MCGPAKNRHRHQQNTAGVSGVAILNRDHTVIKKLCHALMPHTAADLQEAGTRIDYGRNHRRRNGPGITADL